MKLEVITNFTTLGKRRLMLFGDILFAEKDSFGDLSLFSYKDRKYKGYIKSSDQKKYLKIIE